MNVLAIGAHSDDADEFAGGTLARYAQLGHTVGICCMTDGRGFGNAPSVEALIATRKREFEESARLIGAAQTFWLGFPDGGLESNLPTRQALIDVFHDFAPEVLLTHPLDDYHADHIATYHLVTEASQKIRLAHVTYATVLYWESEGGHNFVPDEYVDITPVFDLKLRLMDVHRSQYDFGPDPLTGKVENFLYEDVFAMARFRGMQSSVKYAESFQHCRKQGRMRTYRVLP